jgi:adenosylcobyric acid synthase
MALNSFVTADGGEMGRAQALQAQACGLDADVRMNPVLLKPTSAAGSQIIVMGRPVGRMRAREYQNYKATLWKTVKAAYRSLSEGKDAMILEGAGSPAEINLKAHDIVNMRMARFAGARVLLVADIDRGGAFAGIVGTMCLLGRSDRERVAGYVLNKFRGDATLLKPAIDAVSRRTRKPFLGIVPMLADMRLPEEDSVSFKEGEKIRISVSPPKDARPSEHLDIAVVDLPYISNFTDLDALGHEPGVRVRAVRVAEGLGSPDAVILPGSKNTLADLRFLAGTGLAECLCRYAGQGGTLVGICGGLQLLGQSIADPLELEDGGEATALGLLPLNTRLAPTKQLRRVAGKALPPLVEFELSVAGYEIHHGITTPSGDGALTPLLRDARGSVLGWGRPEPDGDVRVWGTYLHGIFDKDDFRHTFLNRLRRKAGFAPVSGIAYNLEPELDRLADTVERCLEMKAIYSLLGKK